MDRAVPEQVRAGAMRLLCDEGCELVVAAVRPRECVDTKRFKIFSENLCIGLTSEWTDNEPSPICTLNDGSVNAFEELVIPRFDACVLGWKRPGARPARELQPDLAARSCRANYGSFDG